MNRWYLFFVAILLAGSFWVWQSRVPARSVALARQPQPAVGFGAPEFTLPNTEGQQIRLSALRGTPVVINFWATWCVPCRREMPALQATAEHYVGRVTILGIDQGENAELVQEFLDEFGVTYPILLDTDFSVGEQYHVRGMPTTFFIDGDGIIRHVWVGEMNRITLAEGIAQILP